MVDLSNKNIVHKKINGIEYLQFRKLLEYEDILTHCFTLKPLDFGGINNFEQRKEMFLDNYEKICEVLNIDKNNILRPKQTHTDVVKVAGDENGIFLKKFDDVDGIITDKKNKILSTVVADCTPLYLFDPEKKVIGNVHSGWKGTANSIGRNAINKMIETYNCNPKDIICGIGPTIRKCHFEVDEDVKNIFEEKFPNYDDVIIKGEVKEGKQKYFIDTVKINTNMLLEAGLKEKNIIDSGICTVCEADLMHSYRKEGALSGRNAVMIMLK